MVQLEMKDRRRKRLSLSLRVSLLIVLAAVIPSFIVVAASELLSVTGTDRPKRSLYGERCEYPRPVDRYVLD